MTKTMEQVTIAKAYQGEGRTALALWAAEEMPQHILAIRETADHYRAALAMRRHQEHGI